MTDIKVIFLDVDGVLNYSGCKVKCGKAWGIQPEKVALLKQIVDATDAKIVLSSTWRLGYNKDHKRYENFATHLNKALDREGLKIFDVTSDCGNGYRRGTEIRMWMMKAKQDGYNVRKYVILDDESFYDFAEHRLRSRFVHTNIDTGLTEKDVRKAISVLKRK